MKRLTARARSTSHVLAWRRSTTSRSGKRSEAEKSEGRTSSATCFSHILPTSSQRQQPQLDSYISVLSPLPLESQVSLLISSGISLQQSMPNFQESSTSPPTSGTPNSQAFPHTLGKAKFEQASNSGDLEDEANMARNVSISSKSREDRRSKASS